MVKAMGWLLLVLVVALVSWPKRPERGGVLDLLMRLDERDERKARRER